ncbi:S1 RNA-binding domain-containing protein, partial [Xanthobacter autotrophicus]
MANKMLIDATHPEETRVVVVRGNRVEEFDYESASRKQLRGNIYLAKVTRVEPSLQAAFIEYGGNRHGFLAFSEIHPDYYQIPVADRLALIEEEERAARLAEDEADLKDRRRERSRAKRSQPDQSISTAAEPVEHPAPETGEAPAAEEFEAAEGAAPAQDAVTEAPFEAQEASSGHHAEPMSALVAPAEAAGSAASAAAPRALISAASVPG